MVLMTQIGTARTEDKFQGNSGRTCLRDLLIIYAQDSFQELCQYL